VRFKARTVDPGVGVRGPCRRARLSGAEPCDLGVLHVSAWVVGRNGQPVRTEVAPPQQFAGQINPGEELIASFDYDAMSAEGALFSHGGRRGPG